MRKQTATLLLLAAVLAVASHQSVFAEYVAGDADPGDVHFPNGLDGKHECVGGGSLPTLIHNSPNTSAVSVTVVNHPPGGVVLLYNTRLVDGGIMPLAGQFSITTADKEVPITDTNITRMSYFCDAPCPIGAGSACTTAAVYTAVIPSTPKGREVQAYVSTHVAGGPQKFYLGDSTVRHYMLLQDQSVKGVRLAMHAKRVFGTFAGGLSDISVAATSPVAGTLMCYAEDVGEDPLGVNASTTVAAGVEGSVVLEELADDVTLVITCTVSDADGWVTQPATYIVSSATGAPVTATVALDAPTVRPSLVVYPNDPDVTGVIVRQGTNNVIAAGTNVFCAFVPSTATAAEIIADSSVAQGGRDGTIGTAGIAQSVDLVMPEGVHRFSPSINLTCLFRRTYTTNSDVIVSHVFDPATATTPQGTFPAEVVAMEYVPTSHAWQLTVSSSRSSGSAGCMVIEQGGTYPVPFTPRTFLELDDVQKVTWWNTTENVDLLVEFPAFTNDTGFNIICMATDKHGIVLSGRGLSSSAAVSERVFVPAATGLHAPTVAIDNVDRDAGTLRIKASGMTPGSHVFCEAGTATGALLRFLYVGVFDATPVEVPASGSVSIPNFEPSASAFVTAACAVCATSTPGDLTGCSAVEQVLPFLQFTSAPAALTATNVTAARDGDYYKVVVESPSPGLTDVTMYAVAIPSTSSESMPADPDDFIARADASKGNFGIEDTDVEFNIHGLLDETAYDVYVLRTKTDGTAVFYGASGLAITFTTDDAVAPSAVNAPALVGSPVSVADDTVAFTVSGHPGRVAYCLLGAAADYTTAEIREAALATGSLIPSLTNTTIVFVRGLVPGVPNNVTCGVTDSPRHGTHAHIEMATVTPGSVFKASATVVVPTSASTHKLFNVSVVSTLNGDLKCAPVTTAAAGSATIASVTAAAVFTGSAVAGETTSFQHTITTPGSYAFLCVVTPHISQISSLSTVAYLNVTASTYSICATAVFGETDETTCATSNHSLIPYGSIHHCKAVDEAGEQDHCFASTKGGSVHVTCNDTGSSSSPWIAVHYPKTDDCTGTPAEDGTVKGGDSECSSTAPFERLWVHCAGLLTFVNETTVAAPPPGDYHHGSVLVAVAMFMPLVLSYFALATHKFAHMVVAWLATILVMIPTFCNTNAWMEDASCEVSEAHGRMMASAGAGLYAVLLGAGFLLTANDAKFDAREVAHVIIPTLAVVIAALTAGSEHEYVPVIVGAGGAVLTVLVAWMAMGTTAFKTNTYGGRHYARYMPWVAFAVVFFAIVERSDGGLAGSDGDGNMWAVLSVLFLIAAVQPYLLALYSGHGSFLCWGKSYDRVGRQGGFGSSSA